MNQSKQPILRAGALLGAGGLAYISFAYGERVALRACLIALAALVPLGCGGERDQGERAARSPLEPQLASAARVAPGDFPAVGGRTLQQIADTAKAGPQVGLATLSSCPAPTGSRLG